MDRRMGTGRKKIDILPILDTAKRRVTFTKRRQGLFRKLKKLQELTGCPAFSVVFSSAGRPFVFGGDDGECSGEFEDAFGEMGFDLESLDVEEMMAEKERLEELRRRVVLQAPPHDGTRLMKFHQHVQHQDDDDAEEQQSHITDR